MSIFSKAKKAAKRKANEAKRKAESAARKAKEEAERKARQAKAEAERRARQAKAEADRKAAEAKRKADEAKRKIAAAAAEAEKGVNAVIDKLDDATRGQVMSILDDVRKIAHDAENQIDAWKDAAEGAINAARDAAVAEVTQAASTAIDGMDEAFTERLPELVTKQAPQIALQLLDGGMDGLQDFARAIQSSILPQGIRLSKTMVQTSYDIMSTVSEEAPELVQYLDVPRTGTKVGPLKLRWSGFYTRAETLLGVFDRYIESPPRFCRKDLRDYMTALGPDHVDFNVDVKGNAVVVGSTVMEVGQQFTPIPFPLAVFLIDKLLEAAGVPE